jgi:hypothetical protein
MNEEFTLETLQSIRTIAACTSLLETIEEIAAAIGINQIKGMPIREYYDRRRGAMEGDLMRDLADTNHLLASKVKEASEQITTNNDQ